MNPPSKGGPKQAPYALPRPRLTAATGLAVPAATAATSANTTTAVSGAEPAAAAGTNTMTAVSGTSKTASVAARAAAAATSSTTASVAARAAAVLVTPTDVDIINGQGNLSYQLTGNQWYLAATGELAVDWYCAAGNSTKSAIKEAVFRLLKERGTRFLDKRDGGNGGVTYTVMSDEKRSGKRFANGSKVSVRT